MEVKHDIGALLKSLIGISPQNSAGATINGTGFSRDGFDSCVLVVAAGATTGAPTSFTVDGKLQSSDAVGGTYADITGAAITALTAIDTIGNKNVDLGAIDEFIRAVVITAFVGGTAPTVDVAAVVILGGADVLPAA